MIFHSYVAVYQRVSSSLLDFENWVYSLVDPKKFPFCNGRSVGRSRARSLSLFLPPPLSLSLVPFLRVLFEHHVWFSSVVVWWFTQFTPKKGDVMSTKEFPHSECGWTLVGYEHVFSHQPATNWCPADFKLSFKFGWYQVDISDWAHQIVLNLLIVVDSTPTFF